MARIGSEILKTEEIKNSVLVSKMFERIRPRGDHILYSPESQGIYHIYTYGLLLDQLVRRVDPKRRSIAQFFEEEIATPLGIAQELRSAPKKDGFHRY